MIAAGEPISVMVNGGEAPPVYAVRFREVQESAVVGHSHLKGRPWQNGHW